MLAEKTASHGEAAGNFQPQSAVFTEQTQHRINARWSNDFRGAFMPIEAGKLALETIRLFLLAQEQSVEIDNSNLIIYRLLPQANRSRTNGYLLPLAGAGLASLR